jgi:hypothetical protein
MREDPQVARTTTKRDQSVSLSASSRWTDSSSRRAGHPFLFPSLTAAFSRELKTAFPAPRLKGLLSPCSPSTDLCACPPSRRQTTPSAPLPLPPSAFLRPLFPSTPFPPPHLPPPHLPPPPSHTVPSLSGVDRSSSPVQEPPPPPSPQRRFSHTRRGRRKL